MSQPSRPGQIQYQAGGFRQPIAQRLAELRRHADLQRALNPEDTAIFFINDLHRLVTSIRLLGYTCPHSLLSSISAETATGISRGLIAPKIAAVGSLQPFRLSYRTQARFSLPFGWGCALVQCHEMGGQARDGKGRLKGGCSHDWLPHSAA